jgi:hypothetical protein
MTTEAGTTGGTTFYSGGVVMDLSGQPQEAASGGGPVGASLAAVTPSVLLGRVLINVQIAAGSAVTLRLRYDYVFLIDLAGCKVCVSQMGA